MKIARCTCNGSTTWAIVDREGGIARPFAGALEEWAPRILAGGGERALRFAGQACTLAEVRLLPPIERGAKVLVAGANYLKHLTEFRLEPPKSPFVFMKPLGALIGAFDEIVYPPLTRKLDFEVELVAVVGAPLIEGADPARSVLGYTVGNDVSARDLQQGPGGAIGMDFLSGKGLDRSTGLGPWIVTRDEFGDATPNLRMTLEVNGETRQDARTADMRWTVAELLAFVDARSALEPGDILFTGTPAGVAQGDGRFLVPGDIVEATIERIGTLRNQVRAGIARRA